MNSSAYEKLNNFCARSYRENMSIISPLTITYLNQRVSQHQGGQRNQRNQRNQNHHRNGNTLFAADTLPQQHFYRLAAGLEADQQQHALATNAARLTSVSSTFSTFSSFSTFSTFSTFLRPLKSQSVWSFSEHHQSSFLHQQNRWDTDQVPASYCPVSRKTEMLPAASSRDGNPSTISG